MKKILITGTDSFIGTAFENYINNNFYEQYEIESLDVIGDLWRDKSFSGYDVVFHVAGIAHSDNGKISSEKKQFYHRVNTDLAVETAKKAKADGVNQFIFMSSAIVYGDSTPIGTDNIITQESVPAPANCYADSKLQAELGILQLQDKHFKVVILRSPMVYGKNSKGNFPVLEKIALKTPVFPKIENKRSMIYIGNLIEFVRLLIKNEESGIFWPQNAEYSNTSELVKLIASAHGRKIMLVPGLENILKFIGIFTGLVNKSFGNLAYDQKMSEYKEPYQLFNLADSLEDMKNDN